MKRGAKSNGLLHALRQLLPTVTLSVIHERPWHSLTFSGVQLCISVVLEAELDADFATRLAQCLSELQFDLRGQLVADIAVIEIAADENPIRLIIDALLLDD